LGAAPELLELIVAGLVTEADVEVDFIVEAEDEVVAFEKNWNSAACSPGGYKSRRSSKPSCNFERGDLREDEFKLRGNIHNV
jgi:hypothetical protein